MITSRDIAFSLAVNLTLHGIMSFSTSPQRSAISYEIKKLPKAAANVIFILQMRKPFRLLHQSIECICPVTPGNICWDTDTASSH